MFIKKILLKWQFDIAFCMHLLCNLLYDMQRFSLKINHKQHTKLKIWIKINKENK